MENAQIPFAKQNKNIKSELIFLKQFLFPTILTFKFDTFFNEQFGELFQKRFAGGICDFRGPRSCIA